MKKLLFILSVLFASFCVSGCSKDDDDFNPNAIPPVSLANGTITDFFNSELPELHSSSDVRRYTKSFFYDPNSYGGMCIKENMAYVINSRQELADVYLGDKELPVIDFDRYTLIIGQQILPYLGFYVAKKELLAGDEGLILHLYARNDGELLPCALQNLYFWGLYPKQSQKTITVNVIEEYTNRPDKQK